MLSFIGILPVHFLLQSHPTWVRGLKFNGAHLKGPGYESHPTWVRGLKFKPDKVVLIGVAVAPYLGAWIEITLNDWWILTATASRTLPGCVD